MKLLLGFLFLTYASARLFENTVDGTGKKVREWQEIPNANNTIIAERWTTGDELLIYLPNQEAVTSVQLLDDLWVDVEKTAFEFVSSNIWNWRGKVQQAEETGKLVLTIVRDDVTGAVTVLGKVQVDQRIFVFSAGEGSNIRIVEINEMHMPPMKGIYADDVEPLKDIVEDFESTEPSRRYPIVVLAIFPYSSAQCNSQTTINLINQRAASYQNQMRSTWTSEYNIPVEVVGRCLVYNYNNNMNTALSFIRGSSNVAQIRNSARGDLVVLMVSGGGYCGLGYVPRLPVTNSDQSLAFSVVATGCVSIFTIEHECGHNMGLNHDRHVGRGATTGNYGGFNPSGSNQPRYRSIMSYVDYCRSVGRSCAIYGEYSDNGRSWGNPPGTNWPGPADNRRYFLQAAPVVANYR